MQPTGGFSCRDQGHVSVAAPENVASEYSMYANPCSPHLSGMMKQSTRKGQMTSFSAIMTPANRKEANHTFMKLIIPISGFSNCTEKNCAAASNDLRVSESNRGREGERERERERECERERERWI